MVGVVLVFYIFGSNGRGTFKPIFVRETPTTTISGIFVRDCRLSLPAPLGGNVPMVLSCALPPAALIHSTIILAMSSRRLVLHPPHVHPAARWVPCGSHRASLILVPLTLHLLVGYSSRSPASCVSGAVAAVSMKGRCEELGISFLFVFCLLVLVTLVTAPLITGSGECSVVGCVMCFLCLLGRGGVVQPPVPPAYIDPASCCLPAKTSISQSWLQQDPSILDQESQPLVSSPKLQAHRQVLA